MRDRGVESEHLAINMVGIADAIVGIDCQVPGAALPGSNRGAKERKSIRALDPYASRHRPRRSAINHWVRDAGCDLFHYLPEADRIVDLSRAPDRA